MSRKLFRDNEDLRITQDYFKSEHECLGVVKVEDSFLILREEGQKQVLNKYLLCR